MLIPKKVKHRKWHNQPVPKNPQVATRKTVLAFGEFGLKSQEGGWITARQIEAARRAMTRFVQRGGKIWVRIFPQRPVTLKGGEIRMGSGKGAVDHYVSIVKPGTVLFEIDGVAEAQAREAMRLASHKLSVKTSFIQK
ncbi:MAG: 50S ribosomal protein L16 [Candidatus Kerfeldbacteria bacterium]|nr:50S ribosomal protein L16 [Candidatus Kerfeldbacteria bacterium]